MEKHDNLLAQSLKAAGWSYTGVAGTAVLQIVASVLFARGLGAEITGMFAFGLLVFPPFRFLAEYGMGAALIDAPTLSDGDRRALLSRSILLSVVMAICWLICLPTLAALVHQEPAIPPLRWFALVLLTIPILNVCTAILSRKLEQAFLQVSSIVAYAFGYLLVGAVGIYLGWGLWSLVFGFLMQYVINAVLLVRHTRVAVRWTPDRLRPALSRFGRQMTSINLSNWLNSCLDNMAIAFFFDAKALGIYSIAYALVRTPADKIVTTLQGVLYPASALARDHSERLQRGGIAVMDAVLIITAPAYCTIAAIAPTVVLTLYGKSWSPAALVLPAFALGMVFHCQTVVVSSLLWGSGGVRRDMRIQWVSAVLLLLGVIMVAPFGFQAVAWVVLPVMGLRAAWCTGAWCKTVQLPFRRVLRACLAAAILTALITPLVLLEDRRLAEEGLTAPSRLVAEGATAATLWTVLVFALRRHMLTSELNAALASFRRSIAQRVRHA